MVTGMVTVKGASATILGVLTAPIWIIPYLLSTKDSETDDIITYKFWVFEFEEYKKSRSCL